MASSSASLVDPSRPPTTNREVQSDWPVNLAALALRKSFLQNLFGRTFADENEPLSQSALGILRGFYRALIHPAGRTRLGLWIELFGKSLRDDWSKVLNWQQTRNFDQRQSELQGEDRASILPDFPEKDGKADEGEIRRLLKLFEQLLGMAVMRPVIGDQPLKSPVYYAAFHHPLFTTKQLEETKQLILESVIVPAGLGSVGRCLANLDGTV